MQPPKMKFVPGAVNEMTQKEWDARVQRMAEQHNHQQFAFIHEHRRQRFSAIITQLTAIHLELGVDPHILAADADATAVMERVLKLADLLTNMRKEQNVEAEV